MRERTNLAARPRLARETLRLYWTQMKLMPGYFTLTYIASTLFVLFNDLAPPYLLGTLVDELVSADKSLQDVNKLLWMIGGSMFLAFVFARTTFWLRNRSLTATEKRLNMMVFDAYGKQEYSFFTNNFVGSLVSRAGRFTTAFKDLYDMSAFALVGFVIQLVGPVIILATKSPILSVIFIVAALFTFGAIVLTNKFKSPALRASAAAGSKLTGELADSLTNNLAIKVFAAGAIERKRFNEVAENRRRLYLHQANTSENIRIVRSIINVLFFVISTVVLAKLAFEGTISIGVVILAQLYLTRLEQTLWDLNRISERIEESVADAAEMTEVILRKPAVNDVNKPIDFRVSKGEVAFNGVDFKYLDASDEDVLFQNLNLVITPGQKVGLVGPSGGGKTTLTKVLLRFMDIQGGQIAIDSQDIALARQDDVRSSIAYVPQEPLLFHRSIRENIAYGDPDASDEQIIEAAKLAHAHEFISKLPSGYETLVGERGVKLSGGEKQRVAIARAMLKKSPIVVLDEATSALDSKSEKAIVGALDNLMKGRTTIVIAHRLSTIRKLDRIVVLKDGKIVEDGTHAELLKENGLYAELWSHQSGEFLPEE